MEGAVNFRMRSGAQIDGVEIGSEYGSFGTAQNWAIGGKKIGDFDLSLFASDVRSDGDIYHTDYNTQTFDFLGTWSPTPTDRVVLKLMQNDWFSDMGGRENFTQYTLNPFQQGYGCAYQTTLNLTVLRGRRRALAGQRHLWKRRPDAKSCGDRDAPA